MKKTLAIHEIRKEFFNAPLENYILTFDDGLYSQYYYWPLIKKIKTKKTFFITTNFIGNGPKREQFSGDHREFPSCYDALQSWKDEGNRENYMRLSELKEMINDGAAIGGHSHNHIKFYEGSLVKKIDDICDDIEAMIDWFKTHLNFVPDEYAYPHYEDFIFLKILLKDYGFNKLYGRERIEIEKEENIFPFL